MAGTKNMAAKPIISEELLIVAERTAQRNARMRGNHSVDPRCRAISTIHGLSIEDEIRFEQQAAHQQEKFALVRSTLAVHVLPSFDSLGEMAEWSKATVC